MTRIEEEEVREDLRGKEIDIDIDKFIERTMRRSESEIKHILYELWRRGYISFGRYEELVKGLPPNP